MRLSLGFSSKNLALTLTRWGAELRSAFFLGDEDFEPKTWSFELSDLRTSTAGVTFSNLDIGRAQYLHVGRTCIWTLRFSVQGSADYANIMVPFALPRNDWDGTRDADRVPHASGLIWPCRMAALGAVSMGCSPTIGNESANSDNINIAPSMAPPMFFYTNAGTVPTIVSIAGFYFTKKLPTR